MTSSRRITLIETTMFECKIIPYEDGLGRLNSRKGVFTFVDFELPCIQRYQKQDISFYTASFVDLLPTSGFYRAVLQVSSSRLSSTSTMCRSFLTCSTSCEVLV